MRKNDKFDTIIVDPLRSGLDQKVIKTLLDVKPNNIIYVSCDPITLARDLNILEDKYDIIELAPYDMFGNTYHVECVCFLKRK